MQPETVIPILQLNTIIPCLAGGGQSTGVKISICPAPPLLCGLNRYRTLSYSGIAPSFLFPHCHFLVFLNFYYDAVQKSTAFWFQCCSMAFLYIREAISIWCVHEPCGSVGVACQNKRVAKDYSRQSGKIPTLRVVFFLPAVNIPSFAPHAFQVSSNSNNHTIFGRTR